MMLCVHSQEKNKKQNKENKKQILMIKQNQKSLKENMKIKCLVDTITNTIFKVLRLRLSRHSLQIDR